MSEDLLFGLAFVGACSLILTAAASSPLIAECCHRRHRLQRLKRSRLRRSIRRAQAMIDAALPQGTSNDR